MPAIEEIKENLREAWVKAMSTADALEEDEGKIKLVDKWRSVAETIKIAEESIDDIMSH